MRDQFVFTAHSVVGPAIHINNVVDFPDENYCYLFSVVRVGFFKFSPRLIVYNYPESFSSELKAIAETLPRHRMHFVEGENGLELVKFAPRLWKICPCRMR